MPNRLANAPSLYLRQHGEDPVDWHAWDDDALAAARAAGKPILLSIGYSACHWCHVMARESFADPATAALMNAHFLNIKVDREERPDLDRVYQLAHQALQRRGGGWPLTVFLDPANLVPFFVGTYFPPEARHGLPAFRDVLQGLARWYAERPAERAEQAQALAGFLRDYGSDPPEQGPLSLAPLQAALAHWRDQADADNGGWQGAPKFPHPVELGVLQRRGDETLRAHVRLSLARMAEGGLQDQLGGGFFRYCVDADWGIPHFEKMLSDNALLLPLYARRAAEGDALSRRAAIGIVSWLQEEMARREGGFAAALDADSGHEEGAFYVWTAEEFAASVDAADLPWLRRHYGLDTPPNFEGRAWHLRQRLSLDSLAEVEGLAVASLYDRAKRARTRLRLRRAQRTAPVRDDKLLAGWNGLLLSGLAIAGRTMQRADCLDLAAALAGTLRDTLWRDGILHAVAYGNTPAGRGFLDDYAALGLGLLDLCEAHWRAEWLDFAQTLAEAMLADFEDVDGGGLWFTAHDQPPLPQRPKPCIDEATPAGNGMAAQLLLRLGGLLGEPRYLVAAERILRAAWPTMTALPQGCASLLDALLDWRTPPPLLIARLADANEHARWEPALQALQRDGARVFIVPAEASLVPEAIEDKRWLRGGRVYWCEGLTCLPRFDSPVALEAQAARLKARREGLA